MRREGIENIYPLSPAQEGILFHSLFSPDSGVYISQISCTLRNLDVGLLERAWQLAIDRHSMLRTSFIWVKLRRPHQVVSVRAKLTIDRMDWTDLTEQEQAERFEAFLLEDQRKTFQLSHSPLMRMSLLRTAETTYRWVWTHHHLLLDGWSVFLIFREVFLFYEAFNRGKVPDLGRPRPFSDYIAWLQQQDLSKAESFWRETLRGFTSPVSLGKEMADDGRTRNAKGSADRIVQIPQPLVESLKSFAQEHRLTLNTLIQGAFALTLSHLSGSSDLVFGVTVSGRPTDIQGIDSMVGLFINVIPMRVRIHPTESLLFLLQSLQRQQAEMSQYEYSPLSQIQKWSEVPRGQQLFQSILSFENYPASQRGEKAAIHNAMLHEVKSLEIKDFRWVSRNNYPLTLIVGPRSGLSLHLVYDRDLFQPELVTQLLEQFQFVLKNLAALADTPVRKVPELLNEVARQQHATEHSNRNQISLERFKKVRPKLLNISSQELVKIASLEPGHQIPLCVQPAIDDCDLTDWMKNNLQLIETRLLERGAILFRGFNLKSISEFERAALTICPGLFDEYGDLPRESLSKKVYGSTPYPADQAILFHNESSHMHQWPMKISFFCVQPAEQGGETPIVDCRKVYQMLPPTLRERFRRKKIMYIRNYTGGLDVSWPEFFRTDDRAAVEEYCRKASIDFEWKRDDILTTRQVRPAIVRHPRTGEEAFFNQLQLHHISCFDSVTRESLLSVFGEADLPRNVCYGDGSAIEDSVMEEISEIYRSLAASFPWRKGDLLLLDNMLTAHGRNPYKSPRKIVVAMGEMITSNALAEEAR